MADPRRRHPRVGEASRCGRCGGETVEEQVKEDNYNGNGGRPVIRCSECGKFRCFGDMRGVHADNPGCDCAGQPASRRQVAGEGWGQTVGRAVHYRCAVGACEYFEYEVDEEGETVVVESGPLAAEEMEARGL